MVLTLLQQSADGFIRMLEKFTQGKFWVIKAAIVIACISILYDVPVYHAAKSRMNAANAAADSAKNNIPSTSQMIGKQIENPLLVVPAMNGNHAEKVQFRLVIPVIGHVLHLNFNRMVMFYHLMGILLFVVILLLTERVTNDRVLSILIATGLAFTYLCKACIVDVFGWFDGMAYFFLALAMFSKKPPLIFLFVFLAAFTDERGLIASGLVFIWWKLQSVGDKPITLKSLFSFDMASSAVIIAWVAYIGARVFLTKHYGFQTHTGRIMGDQAVWKNTYKHLAMAMLEGLKWFWIYIALGFFLLFKKKNYFLILLMLVGCGAVFFAAMSVKDILKSITYIFPAIFIALHLMYKDGESPRNLRYMAQTVMVLSLFTLIDLFELDI